MSQVTTTQQNCCRVEECPGAPAFGPRWPVPLQLGILVTLATSVFANPFLQLVEQREVNGYAHVEFAQKIAETGVLYPGHFLYHVLTGAVHGLVPLSWLQAHVVVVLALRVLLAVVIWSLVRQSLRSRDSANDALLTIVLTLGLLVSSAVSFPSWGQGNYYLGYIVPNIYVSQTLVALQPLALLTFVAVVRVLTASRPGPTGWQVMAMAVLAILSTLAKPSYAMVLLPAVGVFLLLQGELFVIAPERQGRLRMLPGRWLENLKSVMILAAGLALPTLIALGWVYFSTYLTYQQLDAMQDTGVRIAPFKVMAYFQSLYVPNSEIPFWLLVKFLLSLVFPLTVAIAYFPQARRDPRFVLAWLQCAFGLIFVYFVAEDPIFGAGNFTWSGQIALSILFVVSLLILVERTLDGAASRWRITIATPAAAICYAAFLLHVIAGFGMLRHPNVN